MSSANTNHNRLMRILQVELELAKDFFIFHSSRGRGQSSLFALLAFRNKFDSWLRLPLCGRAAIQAKVIVVSAPSRPASSSLCWSPLRPRAGLRTLCGTVSHRLRAELRTMGAFSPQCLPWRLGDFPFLSTSAFLRNPVRPVSPITGLMGLVWTGSPLQAGLSHGGPSALVLSP
jgi:hypothetical protein